MPPSLRSPCVVTWLGGDPPCDYVMVDRIAHNIILMAEAVAVVMSRVVESNPTAADEPWARGMIAMLAGSCLQVRESKEMTIDI